MQDWGIENADPFRLDEFSTYYQDHSESFDWGQQLWVGELLLESANDALLGNVSTDITPEEVIDLILKNIETEGTQHLLNYWRGLPSPDHFLISAILRERLKPEGMELLEGYK